MWLIIIKICMDVNKINELAQHLDAVEAEKFPTIID